jgi:DNA polymerase III delta subunit
MAGSGRPAAVQAIVGEDSYLAEAALGRVLRAAVGDGGDEATRVFYGDETKWAEVLGAARTGSLFAPSRAIVVRRAELFPEDRGRKEEREGKEGAAEDGASAGGGAEPDAPVSGRKGRKASPSEHPLLTYASSPAPDVTLVLIAARPDKRRQPWKALLPHVEVHEAAPLRRAALRSYVEQELRRRGLRLSRDVLSFLIDEVGQDLRRLMGEIDKLEAFVDGRAEIAIEDVSGLLGKGLGQPLYLMSDAFAARDTPRALELLERLLGEGEQGPLVVATLHRALRQVRGAVALRSAGMPAPQIGARLLPPHMQFKLEALLTASRRWSEADIRRAIALLEKTDRGIKRGGDAAVALTGALVATTAATSPRRAS